HRPSRREGAGGSIEILTRGRLIRWDQKPAQPSQNRVPGPLFPCTWTRRRLIIALLLTMAAPTGKKGARAPDAAAFGVSCVDDVDERASRNGRSVPGALPGIPAPAGAAAPGCAPSGQGRSLGHRA